MSPPRPAPFALAALAMMALGAAPRRGSAQVQPPEFVVGLSGGYTFGRDLWALRQLVIVPEPGPLLIDTFQLARGLATGPSLWVGLTWYPKPATGFGADVGWVAAQVRTGCSIVGTPQPDAYLQNSVACAYLESVAYPTSAIAALATVTLRATPRRDYSPFVKAGLGAALLGHPYDGVTSRSSNFSCTDCARVIVRGKNRLTTWAGTVAAGVSIGGVSGHRLRVEARDFILGLPILTGPSDPFAEEPLSRASVRPVHRFTIAFGLDIVLSASHRRRY